jgi:hypothetical protein
LLVVDVHAAIVPLSWRNLDGALRYEGGSNLLPVTMMIADPDATSSEVPVNKKPGLAPLWLARPADHDYPAAASYLELLFPKKQAAALVAALKKAKVTRYKAKDIFRASRLSLLGISNLHVDRDRQKIKRAVPLSPLLLVRAPELGVVIVADGYHRLCAVYGFDEDALIPCKIV